MHRSFVTLHSFNSKQLRLTLGCSRHSLSHGFGHTSYRYLHTHKRLADRTSTPRFIKAGRPAALAFAFQDEGPDRRKDRL
jgi:hypothetical protein